MRNFIPGFIEKKFEKKEFTGKEESIVISVDVVGFTAITENLVKFGKEGAEILSDMLNQAFQPSIKLIYKHGGWISGFAGDAFTVLFNKKDLMNSLFVLKQLRKNFNNLEIKSKFGNYKLAVKIGFSQGVVNWEIGGDGIQYLYLFSGNGLKQANLCQQQCKPGQILFDKRILNEINSEIKYKKQGRFFRVVNFNLPKSIKQKTSTYKINQKSLAFFVPDCLLELKELNEFRKVVPVFISPSSIPDFQNLAETLIALVNKYQGYINKINYGDKGYVILVLFGAPKAVERPIEKALNFLLELKQLYSEEQIRAGVGYGTAYAGIIGSGIRSEYTVLGDIVNCAARIMMKADWNSIYTDKEIYHRANQRFNFSKGKDLKIKGFSRKQEVFELISIKSEIFEEFSGKLIGRDIEMKQLQSALMPLNENKFGGVFYIDGLPGIGKSRLVHEFLNTLDQERYSFIHMVCDEIVQQSFNPLIYWITRYFKQSDEKSRTLNKKKFESILNNLVKSTKDEAIREELIRTKPFLGGLIGLDFKSKIMNILGARERYENTVYAVKNLLKAVSLQKPLLIIIEDTHWIDEDSKNFLGILTRNIEEFPILIMILSRLNNDGSSIRFQLGEIKQQEILLKNLNDEASKEFIFDKLQHSFTDDFFSVIRQKSEGNPFFMEQIIMFLRENRAIQMNKTGQLEIEHDKFEVPAKISDIIISRIDNLEAKLKTLVKTASVLGLEIHVRVLSEMLKKKRIKKQMDSVQQEGIWSAIHEFLYIFKHALIRDTVYEMQMKKTLINLHTLAGESIEKIYKDNPEPYFEAMAYHFEQANAAEKAIKYLKLSGEKLKRNYNNLPALAIYKRLLAYLEDELEKAIVYNNMGEIYHLISKYKEGEKFLRKAIEIFEKVKKTNLLIKAKINLSRLLWINTRCKESIELCNELLKITKVNNDQDSYSTTLSEMGSAFYYMGQVDESMACHREKLKLEHKRNNLKEVGHACDDIGYLYSERGEHKKAEKYYKKALKIALDLDDMNLLKNVYMSLSNMYASLEEYKSGEEMYGKLMDISSEIGDSLYLTVARYGVAFTNLYVGNFELAKKIMDRSFEESIEYGNNMGSVYIEILQAKYYEFKGDFKRAKAKLISALKNSEKVEVDRLTGSVNKAMGDMYFIFKKYDKAKQYYRVSVKYHEKLEMFSYVCDNLNKLTWISLDQGDLSKARELNRKSQELLKNINSLRNNLESNILRARIIAQIDKGKAEQLLLELLGRVEKTEYMTMILFWLYNIMKKPEYRTRGIRILEKLIKENPRYQFKEWLKEFKG